MRLHDYSRSSAAYRVRIALRLKGLSWEAVPIDLRRGTHRTLDYLARNPQGLVPTIEDDDVVLTQSMAIVEYLDEKFPEPPLLPADPVGKAQVRSLAQHLACEIGPLTSLRVLQHLQHRLGVEDRERSGWYRHWIAEGFASFEARLATLAGAFCYGDRVTLADLCLIPQVYNARRYNCDLVPFPQIRRIEAACLRLPAFDEARPEKQLDAA